jgi:hypothetical protein
LPSWKLGRRKPGRSLTPPDAIVVPRQHFTFNHRASDLVSTAYGTTTSGLTAAHVGIEERSRTLHGGTLTLLVDLSPPSHRLRNITDLRRCHRFRGPSTIRPQNQAPHAPGAREATARKAA